MITKSEKIVLAVAGTGFGARVHWGFFPDVFEEMGFEWKNVNLPGRYPSLPLTWKESIKMSLEDYATLIGKTIKEVKPNCKNLVVVSHSTGATAALLALSRLDRASSPDAAIALSPSPFWGKWLPVKPKDFLRVSWLPMAFNMFLLRPVSIPADYIQERYLNGSTPPPGFLEKAQPESGRVSLQIFLSLIKKPNLQNIAPSILFVGTENDKVVPAKIVRQMANEFSGEFFSVPGGHFFFLYDKETTQKIAQKIISNF